MTRTQRIDNIKQPTHETSQADKGSLDGKSKQLPLQNISVRKVKGQTVGMSASTPVARRLRISLLKSMSPFRDQMNRQETV
jgi:hypothetical protein